MVLNGSRISQPTSKDIFNQFNKTQMHISIDNSCMHGIQLLCTNLHCWIKVKAFYYISTLFNQTNNIVPASKSLTQSSSYESFSRMNNRCKIIQESVRNISCFNWKFVYHRYEVAKTKMAFPQKHNSKYHLNMQGGKQTLELMLVFWQFSAIVYDWESHQKFP